MKNLVWKLNCLRCSLVFHDQKLYDEHIKVHDKIIKRKSTEIDKPIKISKISTETLHVTSNIHNSYHCNFCDKSLIDKISYDRHCSTVSHKIKELNLYTLNNESIRSIVSIEGIIVSIEGILELKK
jgi:uncharacterized C2H2 Zn-finger protein